MAIDKNHFWDENYYNHPPLTDDMLAAAEAQLGVKLPDSLIDLLRVQNGGYTKEFIFPMQVATSWADDHVPLETLYGIVTDESVDTAQNIMDTEYMTVEWGLPEKQVLLTGDGHWWISLDYRQGDVPSVCWLDVDEEEDIQIAESFKAFLAGLKPEEDN